MKRQFLFALFCFACSGINIASAAPFTLQFITEASSLTTFPDGVSTGNVFRLNLVVDNGGVTYRGQTWNESHVVSISVTASTAYSSPIIPRSAFSAALSGDSGTITTNATGAVTVVTADWSADLTGGSFNDSNGEAIGTWYINASNDIWYTINRSIGNGLENGAQNAARWRVVAPLPSYSNNTLNGPTFRRAHENCAVLDNTVKYHVQGFSVDTAGSYTMHSTQDYDGFLHLYTGAFDPNNALAHCTNGDDDFNTNTRASQITAILDPNQSYYLVTSGYFNENRGSFTNRFIGPGEVILGATGDCNGDYAVDTQDVTCTINKALAAP